MADVVKDFNTGELIEYLKKNLKLEESHFEILRKEEISGLAFLDITKEEFRSFGLKAWSCNNTCKIYRSSQPELRNYFSQTLDDLKEILRRNKVIGEDIMSIKQFTPVFEEINDDDKAFGHCMDDIILKLTNVSPKESLVILRLDMRRIWHNLRVHSKKRTADQAFGNDIYDYTYGIVTTERSGILLCIPRWYILYEYQINLTKSAVKTDLLRSNVKRVIGIVVGLCLFETESEIGLLRQEIARLMAKITGLESEKAELLKQVAEERAKHEAENAELRSRIEELEKGRTDTVDANLPQSKTSEEIKRVKKHSQIIIPEAFDPL